MLLILMPDIHILMPVLAVMVMAIAVHMEAFPPDFANLRIATAVLRL
jgi:hypothetical protein